MRRRVAGFATSLFILGLVGLAIAVPTTYVAVHETAKSEFCNSCHIMEPYYESWQASSHKDVACIECHYEPGAVETFVGKFKALSQLAKYVTRTQGTKPWAEVSDTSCMRSGCHSVRMLEGEVQFGRVRFDHSPHLLETRRGRRLRCVSCHSQIVQGEHFSVTESVCIMCHFMPASEGAPPPATSDCETCHGAPAEELMVQGRPFSHTEYVGRGVDCRECHSPVVEGEGAVRSERCHSCHGEAGHIERIGETAFLHEMHVTEHKVECFECHDEIRHGLLPLKSHTPMASEACGSCHTDSHSGTSLLYAGAGAVGVEDAPSRMYQTRVVCEACHTGRSEAFDDAAAPLPAWNAPAGKHGAVAAAGNLDCVHCHGPGFDGMLGRWQNAVGEQLERIGPMLTELEQALPTQRDHPALQPYIEARQNLQIVARDGSRGAHNVTYALAALAAGAERIDRSFELLGIERDVRAADGFPVLSKDGCSVCHLGIEDEQVALADGRPFPHGRHLLAAGLDCDTCHSVERHGEPAFARADCASCHHQGSERLDPWECATCHGDQSRFLAGDAGLASALVPVPAPMAEKECTECHGEPPDIRIPSPAQCVLCHEEGYDDRLAAWRTRTDELSAELAAAITAAGQEFDAEVLTRARSLFEAVARDGSHGVHNSELAAGLLLQGLEGLKAK